MRLQQAILFDLDGTLADTAPDLAAAANAVRRSMAMPPLTTVEIQPWVTRGTDAILRIALGLGAGEAVPRSHRAAFLEHYRAGIAVESSLFPTAAELLDALDARATRWGIVTNKPGWLTRPLVRALELEVRAACVVSGDEAERAKPHPDPLLAAARLLGIEPAQCTYVGDARSDIEAGRRAGMSTVAALFGYIGDDDDVYDWGADATIARPIDLLDRLD